MKTYKRLHESKEVANIHIAKIKAKGGEVKQFVKDGKILLEYSFESEKNLLIENKQNKMTLLELDTKKASLLNKANELTLTKKRLYSNVDIESPMSIEEKELNNKIANIFSQINSIVIEKRKLKN